MVMPMLLGGGKSLFTGLRDRVHVKLGQTIVFSSGNVLMTYQPTPPTA